jgi:succinyl-CoA synthetase alpha subunit
MMSANNQGSNMASGFVIRKNQYYDSVFLMTVNRRISEVKGVQQTAVLMGSPANRQLLQEIGIQDAQIDAAQPNDLVVAVIAENGTIVADVLGRLDEWLNAVQESMPMSAVHTVDDGLAVQPQANLAVISVPGEYAARESRKALEAGLHVFLFSDNVSIDEELELKQLATQKGLLVMGPDCGTSLIGGKGIGFANVVRKGPIGVIGAAGTGLQEFTSQVHNAGYGISHAIGTGSHDLSEKIGGLTTFAAFDALERDPQTQVIVMVSKPLAAGTLEHLLKRIASSKKPVVGCFLGVDLAQVAGTPNFQFARTIDDAVRLAVTAIGGRPVSVQTHLSQAEQELLERELAARSPDQKYLRGILAGGTFCYQSQQIFREAGIRVYSNSPFDQKNKLDHPDRSVKHTIVDMGDDYYMVGKPHPMIDGTMRKRRILAECQDPHVAILYLDFILGYNASMDPVGELVDSIREAKRQVGRRGGSLTVVASICGTDADPQDLRLQETILREAGVIVYHSNAQASGACCRLLGKG